MANEFFHITTAIVWHMGRCIHISADQYFRCHCVGAMFHFFFFFYFDFQYFHKSFFLSNFSPFSFLRSGFIVAQAGILNGILIIIATVSLALISVLAAVGICERCRVESGGVYFLIAHTLGSRFGGSLGLLYCFGQAVGCALNVLGFGESMAGLVGLENNNWAIRGFAAAAVLLLGIINVAGVKWVIKLQFLLSLILLCAGLNFMVGSFIGEDPSTCIFF